MFILWNKAIQNKWPDELKSCDVLLPTERILDVKDTVCSEMSIHSVWPMAKKYIIVFPSMFQKICGWEVNLETFFPWWLAIIANLAGQANHLHWHLISIDKNHFNMERQSPFPYVKLYLAIIASNVEMQQVA